MSRARRKGGRRSRRAAPLSRLAALRRALRRRITLVVLLAVVVSAAAVSLFLFGFGSSGPSGPPRAAIVDQLSLTYPNESFAQEATALLEQGGYEVDYFPGEEATVDLFRDLPTHGYEYLVLRVHSSGLLREAGEFESTANTVFFTGEPWSETKYLDEQRARYLARTHYEGDEQSFYFGIVPDFIKSGMKGNFDGATIIAMGCDALSGDTAARRFVDRGAKAVIGWDGLVSASHTDAATERLLALLVADHVPVREAVAQVMTEVGTDPAYGSELLVYPAETSAAVAP